MPKYASIVAMSGVASVLSSVELIFALRELPATGTQRSLGNDKNAARPVLGSTRITMMVSGREPPVAPDRNAPAYGDEGSMQSRLSDPVNKKFCESGGAPRSRSSTVVAVTLSSGAAAVVLVVSPTA